jgi:Holliday junction resolvase
VEKLGATVLTNYANGAAFEREVKADLIAKGWAAVRSAGSHGAIDVMAYHRGAALFVQCKRTGIFPPEERAALVHAAHEHGAIPILAHKKLRGIITYLRVVGASPSALKVFSVRLDA